MKLPAGEKSDPEGVALSYGQPEGWRQGLNLRPPPESGALPEVSVPCATGRNLLPTALYPDAPEGCWPGNKRRRSFSRCSPYRASGTLRSGRESNPLPPRWGATKYPLPTPPAKMVVAARPALPVALKKLRAPSLRVFPVARVGEQCTQPARVQPVLENKAGEQAAAEFFGCPALDDALLCRVTAGFEPAFSAPEVSVAYTTGQGGVCVPAQRACRRRQAAGEQAVAAIRCSATELPGICTQGGNRTRNHRLKAK